MNAPQGEINTRSYLQLFNRATLAIEIIVIFIAGLTAYALNMAPATHVWITTGVVGLLCFLALGLARFPAGIGVAAVVQVLLVLSGIFIPTMWFLGGVFAIIWIISVILGNKIDREKRQYMLTHPEEYPEASSGGYPIS